ncbi:NTP transferase domain-containing protein [Thermodesulfobacteriota bacterium]
MKAVILAAGVGTRLGTLIPKPLTAIENEKVILDYQVEALKEIVGVHNIFVVVGYKKELIMEKHPQLIYIYNNKYIHTNTAKSLLMALDKINQDDVLWMNGDVVFDKEVIDLLVASEGSCCLVDTKNCGKEEIKYTCHSDGNIEKISKKIKDGTGEALGINKVVQPDLNVFKNELLLVPDNAYFEAALENLTLKRKLILKPVNKGEFYCTEVDFSEDLEDVLNNWSRIASSQ